MDHCHCRKPRKSGIVSGHKLEKIRLFSVNLLWI